MVSISKKTCVLVSSIIIAGASLAALTAKEMADELTNKSYAQTQAGVDAWKKETLAVINAYEKEVKATIDKITSGMSSKNVAQKEAIKYFTDLSSQVDKFIKDATTKGVSSSDLKDLKKLVEDMQLFINA